MDVDVLLWGGTHKFEAYETEGKFFVNPGSATGALGTGWWAEEEEPIPSFCLMDVSRDEVNSCAEEKADKFKVQGDVLVLYVYQLKTDPSGVEMVGVEKVSFRKQNPSSAA